ncbi:unnamed protein product [Caenorhabditis nigoni]
MVCVKIVEMASLQKHMSNLSYQIFAPSVEDIFVIPSLVTIPYLFCNRHNVKEMRKRLSLKYLWSKIRSRNNRVGGIDNNNNQVAISYIQATSS